MAPTEGTQMPVAQEIEIQETEADRVVRWRAQELERAGYDPEAAAQLAERNDVDLHRAIERVEPGSAHRHRQCRAAAHPPVRADAARRDPRVRLADVAPLEGDGRRPRPR